MRELKLVWKQIAFNCLFKGKDGFAFDYRLIFSSVAKRDPVSSEEKHAVESLDGLRSFMDKQSKDPNASPLSVWHLWSLQIDR